MQDEHAPQPSSLQIEIANQIMEMIRSGSVAPGEHLTEAALAKRYGVSRSPVRAALKMLQDRGYLEARANAGVFVSKRAPRMRMTALENPNPTAEDLYRSIIADRASGKLPKASSETELMARYGAPKSVLMHALLRLTREGLIRRRRGHGWQFLPGLDSEEALYEAYRFRMIIECAALREPSFKAVPEELAAARRRYEDFLARSPRAQTSSAFFEMNAAFHEMLMRFSGNRYILQAMQQQNQLRRFEEFSSYSGPNRNVIESCKRLLQIIAAIEAGDTAFAEALMLHHLKIASSLSIGRRHARPPAAGDADDHLSP
ncbi:MAG: GntR family transcriptional regulator [Rudaea sp.]|uniref:GntR family transcriptional regulator n=1 Tax=unclassified Rudaea TaxID=2627037 RepID=UPI00148502F2|nr:MULTISPECIES: GntR family transcriptional regulator [unclassified Rudaea]MBN8886094.1 GntR family transcriptional regulator [Rudaea sp.]